MSNLQAFTADGYPTTYAIMPGDFVVDLNKEDPLPLLRDISNKRNLWLRHCMIGKIVRK